MQRLSVLEPDFYFRSADRVARALLGKLLLVGGEGGEILLRITETEAYLGASDRACHSYGGRRTERTEAMYLPGGHAYVYRSYGMHDCLNVVTGGEGDPCAVLLRAGEAVRGGDLCALRRYGAAERELTAAQRKNLLNGPGKLCRALGMDRRYNGRRFCEPDFCLLEDGDDPPHDIRVGKRVGLGARSGPDADLPLRFWIGPRG